MNKNLKPIPDLVETILTKRIHVTPVIDLDRLLTVYRPRELQEFERWVNQHPNRPNLLHQQWDVIGGRGQMTITLGDKRPNTRAPFDTGLRLVSYDGLVTHKLTDSPIWDEILPTIDVLTRWKYEAVLAKQFTKIVLSKLSGPVELMRIWPTLVQMTNRDLARAHARYAGRAAHKIQLNHRLAMQTINGWLAEATLLPDELPQLAASVAWYPNRDTQEMPDWVHGPLYY